MPYLPPSSTDILLVAHAAVLALKREGFECCFVGSAACSAYGMTRTPNDIDIVVLTSIWTSEELKRRVIRQDPKFYTVASKNSMATYRVLWYRLDFRKSCKVDLLVPGTMNIPTVPINRIVYRSDPNLPLMPFLPLLLLKLQAWEDHGLSERMYMRDKQPMDVRDINELLNLCVTRYHHEARLSKGERWLPESFINEAKRRVREYKRRYPASRSQWELIGFK
ncbi:hypothetical protein C8J56DRAFT_913866 [Mycena floridula]|nr:hypothetical protein C8J56DRAFT_913866 [Mycena floridula]